MPACTYPLTAPACVDRGCTELAVFDITPAGVTVRETYGVDVDELAARTGMALGPGGA